MGRDAELCGALIWWFDGATPLAARVHILRITESQTGLCSKGP